MVGMVAPLGLALIPPRSQSSQATDSTRTAPPAAPSARATLATQSPILDARDHDAIWRETPPITDFREWSPTEGKAPRFPTEARIACDRANLYVLVRCSDPHPDSIIRLIGRRDDFP